MYRDSEMPVLAAVGVGPRRLLKPVMMVVLPVLAVVALSSLWLGPRANRLSDEMVRQANKNLLVSGMEPGRFTALPGGGVVYIGSMSNDGTRFSRVFVHRQDGDRLDVTTAKGGSMFLDGERARYLRLDDGFRVEGPAGDGRDFRLMRYARNELRLPDRAEDRSDDDPELLPTLALFGDPRPEAQAQLHRRLTPSLLALAFALLAVPMARSSPRQARHGRLLLAFLAYMVGMNMMYLGTQWLAEGKLPAFAGLWWLSLPMLALAGWLYFRDGRVRLPLRLAKRAPAA
jgi:lipopolysaccharide export system permease protein